MRRNAVAARKTRRAVHQPVIEPFAIVGAKPVRGAYEKARMGTGATVRSSAVIYDGCTIGNNLFCGHSAVIREQCRIGDNVKVGSNSVIDPGCIVEDHATVHSNCYLGEFTHVKKHAWIGPGVITLNTKYPKCGHDSRIRRGSVIGEYSVIGAGAILLAGVRIGAHAMVAAGAVVTKDVPAGKLVMGSPARLVRSVASIRCCPGKRYRQ